MPPARVHWLAFVLVLALAACDDAAETRTGRIIDGDTLVVTVAGRDARVRLIGVDTPEIGQRGECFGQQAAVFVTGLLPLGTPVRLEQDVSERDGFGRLLRYVWMPDGTMLNQHVVRQGYAVAKAYPPDTRYQQRFVEAEQEARLARRGLWGACAVADRPAGIGAATAPNSVPLLPADGACDVSYPGVCIPSPPPDLDCADIPHRRFAVLRPDPHRFDGDRDGVGCAG